MEIALLILSSIQVLLYTLNELLCMLTTPLRLILYNFSIIQIKGH
jgi:hypothetical protein